MARCILCMDKCIQCWAISHALMELLQEEREPYDPTFPALQADLYVHQNVRDTRISDYTFRVVAALKQL